LPKFQTVKVEIAEDIAWVTMNRPEKRNAMTPQMHEEMIAALSELAVAPEAKVLVLTGAGESWSAGQDIELFFRDLDDKPVQKRRAILASQEWTSPSPPRTRSSGSRRSTGASCPAAWSPR
jgi:trans-feruloyl-CoA hydratase/vanillin synthase